ncbi:predicted protein [Naegleria gruberi]|uniref:Predicted protein n=1 Tax=Naegleria gruberi TaxID=5762 RepID=D2VTT7_NAEGR|nr:uncharacterized protein NAEGRDRAFT_72420 [Naegleria gruberi]EFC39783.1 predicted protein [Naegleria gruberi]|eukprot:XP_002672527.1 predicted protein [Naegleria gruberi strain NEG-M]
MSKQQLLEHSLEESSSLLISTTTVVENDEVSVLQVRKPPSQQQYELGKENGHEALNNSSSEENHDTIDYVHHYHHKQDEQDNIITSTNSSSYGDQEREKQSLTSRVSNLIDSMPILKSMLGWLACISVHTLYGTHPIFSRYLQSQSPNKFPPMLLVTSCHMAALLLYSPRILFLLIVYLRNKWKNRKNNKEGMNVNTQHHVVMKLSIFERIKKWIKFSLPLISFFCALLGRSFTNVVASKFTIPLFVQLFALSSPFTLAFVTVFVYNRWFIRDSHTKETFGLKAILSMIATFIGGAIIIIGSIVPKTDGISSSIVSSCCLVWYMLSLRYMKQEESQGNTISVTGEKLFIYQLLILVFIFAVPSAIFDDWTLWARLNSKDWGMFFGFTILVYMMANGLNILAIGLLGSTKVGSIIALRLISTIVFSSLILQESLKSIWQLLGCIIVLLSVTYFMYTESEQEMKTVTVQQVSSTHFPIQEEDEDDDETEMEDTTELIKKDPNENSIEQVKKRREGDIMV